MNSIRRLQLPKQEQQQKELDRRSSNGSQLSPLQFLLVLPECYTPTMDVLANLRKINRLQISDAIECPQSNLSHDRNRRKKNKRRSEYFYMVDVCMTPRTKSRIPNHHPFNDDEIKNQSVVVRRVEHTLTDFTQLRARLLRQVQVEHPTFDGDPCPYCTMVANFIISGSGQPTPMLKWFASQKRRKQQLTRFLTKVLELTLLCKPSAFPACPSQDAIPAIVSDFLDIEMLYGCMGVVGRQASQRRRQSV